MVAFQFNEAVVDMAHQKNDFAPGVFTQSTGVFPRYTGVFSRTLVLHKIFTKDNIPNSNHLCVSYDYRSLLTHGMTTTQYQIHDYPSLPLGRPKKGVIVQSWEWKCGCLSAQDVCYKILTP